MWLCQPEEWKLKLGEKKPENIPTPAPHTQTTCHLSDLCIHIICGTIVSSIIIYVNEEFSQRRLQLSLPSLSLSIYLSLKWPTGSWIVFFRQLERLNILKVEGSYVIFSTAPQNLMTNLMPHSFWDLLSRVVAKPYPIPAPATCWKQTKNTLRRRWSALSVSDLKAKWETQRELKL